MAAHKSAVFNQSAVFVHAVVVAGDGTGADIHAAADLRISQIAQMAGLRALPQAHFFRFHKVADMRLFANLAARTKARIRSEFCARVYARVVDDAALPYQYVMI